MNALRPARQTDVPALARLMVGAVDQPTTQAAIRLFGLGDLEEVTEFTRVMLGSTETWRHTILTEEAGEPVGMVVLGEAAMSLNQDVAAFARRLHGDDFMEVLAPRLAALGRVSRETLPSELLVAEVHVSPARRGDGIGLGLLRRAETEGRDRACSKLALQTLVGNPARVVFERFGFVVTETATDQSFEDLTGVPGFHHMEKPLV